MDIYLKGLEEPLELFNDLDRMVDNIVISGEYESGKSHQIREILKQIRQQDRNKKIIVVTNHLEDYVDFKDIQLYQNRNDVLDIGDYENAVIVFEVPECPTDEQIKYIVFINERVRMKNSLLITSWITDEEYYLNVVNQMCFNHSKYHINVKKEIDNHSSIYMIKHYDDKRWNKAM